MAAQQTNSTWMWHPDFQETSGNTAGLFVQFRRTLIIPPENLPDKLEINITADTRYKLYVNGRNVSFGPVKGDAHLWYFDTVDIAPFLHIGRNQIAVHVLRFFYATSFAASFPRLAFGGLKIWTVDKNTSFRSEMESSGSWETAIDYTTRLRTDEPEDEFLHIYEYKAAPRAPLVWKPVQLSAYQCSTGQSAPWTLSPRLIPPQNVSQVYLSALHGLKSSLPMTMWESTLLGTTGSEELLRSKAAFDSSSSPILRLSAGSVHQVDLEVAQHTTAFLQLRFRRPRQGGHLVTLTYAESYEDEPLLVPYLRHKGHRQDRSKELFGPSDIFELQGVENHQALGYHEQEDVEEIIMPFHFRTFRFIRLHIHVKSSELVLQDIKIEQVNYPLDVVARVSTGSHSDVEALLSTSIRTLTNCMHDCYEDCPFYEQLQYAMDTRSSILFTYYASGDDRLARQAILQLRNSFQASIGLTASRAPCHGSQVIPHFSLFWIFMICDHWLFYGDRAFVAPTMPIMDAVLGYFDARIDQDLGLVTAEERAGVWNFHDWAEEWKPCGSLQRYSKLVYPLIQTTCTRARSEKPQHFWKASVVRGSHKNMYCEQIKLSLLSKGIVMMASYLSIVCTMALRTAAFTVSTIEHGQS